MEGVGPRQRIKDAQESSIAKGHVIICDGRGSQKSLCVTSSMARSRA